MNIIKKLFSLFLILFLAIIFLSCNKDGKKVDKKPENTLNHKSNIPKEIPVKKNIPIEITYKNIPGRWKEIYSNNYGYSFTFRRNYDSTVIVYLKQSAIIFKGIYTVANNRIKINLYKMKHCNSLREIYSKRGYYKSNSSYFLFNSSIIKNKKGKSMILMPEKVIINGNNSEGYFEPKMILKKY